MKGLMAGLQSAELLHVASALRCLLNLCGESGVEQEQDSFWSGSYVGPC